MDSLRLWILGVALGSFAAGMVVGFMVDTQVARGQGAPATELAYANDLAARYGLSSDQQRRLRLVLQHCGEQEIAILKSAQVNQLPPALMGQLLALRTQTEQYVRALLDDEQRRRYDRDSRPPWPQPAGTDK